MVVVLLFLAGIALGPIGGQPHAPESMTLQMAHALNLAMFSYANDNDGKYPDGTSSTEVFQKLVDGGYITDPAYFYVQLKGKSKPVAGQKLRSENVSWDVTNGVDSTSSDQIPVVFLTGFKISYIPRGAAIPLIKPFPRYGVVFPNQSWLDWSEFKYWGDEGIAVAYKGNMSMIKKPVVPPNGNTSIPDFISPDFKPNGKTYRQLTPDGSLPP